MKNFSHTSRLEHWQGDGAGWMNASPSKDGSCLVITDGPKNSLILRNVESATKLYEWLGLQLYGDRHAEQCAEVKRQAYIASKRGLE